MVVVKRVVRDELGVDVLFFCFFLLLLSLFQAAVNAPQRRLRMLSFLPVYFFIFLSFSTERKTRQTSKVTPGASRSEKFVTLTMDAKRVGTELNCYFLPSFLSRNVSFFVPLE